VTSITVVLILDLCRWRRVCLCADVISRTRLSVQSVHDWSVASTAVAILPLFIQLWQLGLVDTLIGVALPQVAFQLSLSVLILRSFFRGVPSELEDASYIDGCGPIGFMSRILLALWVPALAIVRC
jgi:ABC-type glycerol-3-phosphate transport system permease component